MAVPNWSIWHEGAPRTVFPALEGEQRFDVCVIGAGITGLTLAQRLKDAGRSVAIVDMRSVGSGVTGSTSGHLTAVLDRDLASL
jgi:gamma-glutamylputrescine oxidase